MELYIVRHGKTQFNNQNILQGYSVPSHLNDLGKEQAEKLTLRVKHIDFDCIYSSDLDRAVETAEIIINKLKHKPDFIKCPSLRERNYGDCEGYNLDEVKKILNANTKSSIIQEPPDIIEAPPNGESLFDVKNRAEKFIETLKKKHKNNDKILVVTHYGIVVMLTICLLGLSFDNHKNFHFDNCSLSHFCIGNDYNKLTFANDTCHLKI